MTLISFKKKQQRNRGIAIESLIRTLSDFKRKELIEIEGRNIRILDLVGLKQMN